MIYKDDRNSVFLLITTYMKLIVKQICKILLTNGD
jgi:hypothetical protein